MRAHRIGLIQTLFNPAYDNASLIGERLEISRCYLLDDGQMLIRLCLILWSLVGHCFASIDESVKKGNDGLNYTKFSFTKQELNNYRLEVKDLFYFAYDNYLLHAYPFDELRPISCVPKTRNFDDSEDSITNDVLGNFSVTLIDSLTTIAILNDKSKFKSAIDLIEQTFPDKFDIDSTVQVFETTIRILGGLLSSHLYATDPSKKVFLGDEYDGILLDLARDIADRLLPAYLTSTGLPLARINLRHKFKTVKPESNLENNVAAMASPMFEFTMLSYLTNDEKYAAVTGYAINKTWSLRSDIDLLPMSFNPETAQCYSPFTGIGASIDSFYEYALKGAILFDDKNLYNIWSTSYRALVKYCKADWFFFNAQHSTGHLVVSWIDSLSAFFPGLQVLAGDVSDAIYKHSLFLKLWNTFGGIPERWLFQGNLTLISESLGKPLSNEGKAEIPNELHRELVPLEWYPLRPEFIESNYYLYRATKDPFYLNIGIEILESFKTRFKHQCGFGGLQDVISGSPQDRMETFVLSETLKYLYLLFDSENELHFTRDNVILSTEAHPMWLKSETVRSYYNKKFFNDTVYLKHLHNCHKKDRMALIRSDRIYNMKNRLTGFAKSLFVDEKEDLIGKQNNLPDQAMIATQLEEERCTVNFNVRNQTGWSYSSILSDFDRLFEIENRYAETLKRPTYLSSSVALELKQGFYERWSDPSKSLCRLPTTTDPFQVVIEAPKVGHVTMLENGNLRCDSISGSFKFSFEIIVPGKVDVYGDYVTTRLFENINCEDILRPGRARGLYSPTFLYRITAVNGIDIPKGGNVTLDKDYVLKNPVETKSLTQFFGCNKLDQLMFENVPVVNFCLM